MLRSGVRGARDQPPLPGRRRVACQSDRLAPEPAVEVCRSVEVWRPKPCTRHTHHSTTHPCRRTIVNHGRDVMLIGGTKALQLAHDHIDNVEHVDVEMTEGCTDLGERMPKRSLSQEGNPATNNVDRCDASSAGRYPYQPGSAAAGEQRQTYLQPAARRCLWYFVGSFLIPRQLRPVRPCCSPGLTRHHRRASLRPAHAVIASLTMTPASHARSYGAV